MTTKTKPKSKSASMTSEKPSRAPVSAARPSSPSKPAAPLDPLFAKALGAPGPEIDLRLSAGDKDAQAAAAVGLDSPAKKSSSAPLSKKPDLSVAQEAPEIDVKMWCGFYNGFVRRRWPKWALHPDEIERCAVVLPPFFKKYFPQLSDWTCELAVCMLAVSIIGPRLTEKKSEPVDTGDLAGKSNQPAAEIKPAEKPEPAAAPAGGKVDTIWNRG